MKKMCALAVAALAGSALGQASFTGIGDLAGGSFSSGALGISPDGLTVVGYGTVAGDLRRAARWSAGALSTISDPAGIYTPRSASAVAGNGVIVGTASGPNGSEAFKLNASGGSRFRALGGTTPGGTIGSAANAVADSGALVVGAFEEPGQVVQACRWDGPSLTGLGYLSPNAAPSTAYGVSGDGTTIVGGSSSSGGRRGFKIGLDGVMIELASPTGGAAEARSCSLDGAVIVGSAGPAGHAHAVKWSSGAAEDLGDLPGGDDASAAADCSADGAVIVGSAAGPSGSAACVWRGSGIEVIQSALEDAGVPSIAGWTLTAATGVSADGRVVCGLGVNPSGALEGWVASLPDPVPACPADFNGDGFLDFFDYDDYVNCFESGACPPGKTADFNGDGFADFFDYDDFVAAFELGC